jgi:hypothetical protein
VSPGGTDIADHRTGIAGLDFGLFEDVESDARSAECEAATASEMI